MNRVSLMLPLTLAPMMAVIDIDARFRKPEASLCDQEKVRLVLKRETKYPTLHKSTLIVALLRRIIGAQSIDFCPITCTCFAFAS
jgi:hypothetical protein